MYVFSPSLLLKKEPFYLVCCCLILDKEDKTMQPPEKLREALSSKEAFTRTYLVLSLFFFLNSVVVFWFVSREYLKI